MFEGDDGLMLYCEDTGRRLAGKCLIHDALIRELKEMFGDANVVVK